MYNYNFIKKTSCLIFIVFCICLVLSICIFPNQKIFAEQNVTSEYAQCDKMSVKFAEKTENRWFSPAYRIYYASKDDYSNWTTDPVYPKFYDGTKGYALNDELFKVDGTDSSGTTRIEPVHGLGAANNINAQSYATINISQFRTIESSYKCEVNDDTRKLKDLQADLKVENSDVQVYYGKALYRVATGAGQRWGNWNYANLNVGVNQASTTITFNGPQCVQVVVIYEIRENPTLWFYQYYHIVGVYRFDIV